VYQAVVYLGEIVLFAACAEVSLIIKIASHHFALCMSSEQSENSQIKFSSFNQHRVNYVALEDEVTIASSVSCDFLINVLLYLIKVI